VTRSRYLTRRWNGFTLGQRLTALSCVSPRSSRAPWISIFFVLETKPVNALFVSRTKPVDQCSHHPRQETQHDAARHRSYETDGDVRIAVSDSLGLADGVYSLAVRGGKATVTADRANGAPSDVSMDVAALGSLYLGGVRVDTLARTGGVTAQSRDAIDLLDALLTHREQPYCITHF